MKHLLLPGLLPIITYVLIGFLKSIWAWAPDLGPVPGSAHVRGTPRTSTPAPSTPPRAPGSPPTCPCSTAFLVPRRCPAASGPEWPLRHSHLLPLGFLVDTEAWDGPPTHTQPRSAREFMSQVTNRWLELVRFSSLLTPDRQLGGGPFSISPGDGPANLSSDHTKQGPLGNSCLCQLFLLPNLTAVFPHSRSLGLRP